MNNEDSQENIFRIEFGKRLREERERMGLSQEDFAQLGGIQKLAQLNYEKGERSPTAEYLANIESYGVDIGYLFDGLRPILRQPIEIKPDLLAEIIWRLETAISAMGATIPAKKKARAIVMLYQAFSVSERVDEKVINDAALLAVDED